MNKDANFGLFLSSLVPLATWVGGGFILGVAEAVYTPKLGLLWALMPLQYSMAFIFGKTPQTEPGPCSETSRTRT